MSYLRSRFATPRPYEDMSEEERWRNRPVSLEACEADAATSLAELQRLHPPRPVLNAHPDDYCRDCFGKGRVWDENDEPGAFHHETTCPTCSGRGHH